MWWDAINYIVVIADAFSDKSGKVYKLITDHHESVPLCVCQLYNLHNLHNLHTHTSNFL